jgi:hypothetical protein
MLRTHGEEMDESVREGIEAALAVVEVALAAHDEISALVGAHTQLAEALQVFAEKLYSDQETSATALAPPDDADDADDADEADIS